MEYDNLMGNFFLDQNGKINGTAEWCRFWPGIRKDKNETEKWMGQERKMPNKIDYFEVQIERQWIGKE